MFVADGTKIVTHSELRGLLEEYGSVGMVAQRLGVVSSTVSRHLTQAGVPVQHRFGRRMANEIDRLEGTIEAQQGKIERLERRLARRGEN